jgi:hypothetical protein
MREHLRLVVSAKRERDVEFRNTEVGVDLELSLRRFRPVIFPRRLEQDDVRMRRMTVRFGYRFKRSFNTDSPINEHRPAAELTLRWAIPEHVLISNRSRGEFRFVNGEYSWRYRNELKLERDFPIGRYAVTGYASAEPFYNSSANRWDRFRFSGGVVLPIRRYLHIDSYYLRQIVTDAQPRNINAIGLALKLYIPR